MKIASIIGSSALVAALSLSLVATSAQAQMSQSQSQQSSQSSNFSSNCSGSCSSTSTTFSSSSTLEQSQSQSSGWSNYSNTYNKPYGYKKNKPKNGKITVGWEFDEGTCYIRYTEANTNNGTYKYSTSAACSDGETTISGLRRGTVYRFQVKQDNGEWSEPLTMQAY